MSTKNPPRAINFFKEIVEFLHGILAPIAKTYGDPLAREQFERSLGFSSDTNIPGSTMPSGSVMESYIKNQNESKDTILLAQALAEAAQIMDVLQVFIRTATAPYYGIVTNDVSFNDQQKLALSELLTIIINIFTLDYFRLRYPVAHNWFLMAGIVDEMSQRAGGSGFIGDVICDYFSNLKSGFSRENDEGIRTLIEALGLSINILKKWKFDKAQLFFSSGFETHSTSTTKHADIASRGIISIGWFFQKDEAINGNLYLTLGLIPKSRGGKGYFAKINSPGVFEKKFSDQFTLRVEAEGDLDFYSISNHDLDINFGQSNRASIIFKGKFEATDFIAINSPRISLGFDEHHSVELRINREEIGVIAKTEINIKLGKGDAKFFPFSLMPVTQLDKTIPAYFGWTTKRGFFISDSGTAGSNNGQSDDQDNNEEDSKPNLFFFNVPIRAKIGGLNFLNLHIGVGRDEETTIIESSLDFTIVIGSAFKLTVTRLGARAYITPVDDFKGFLGRDIDLDFKTPTGIGMNIDLGFVKGGGFLSYDEEKAEYFGALELELDLKCLSFTIKAFGLIQTELPGGDEGEYSLFVVVSSEFESIPLVLGLTLEGIGGLFGHNRTVDIELVQSEMRSPGLKNILFLEDPIVNINRIVTDSGRYFPIAPDKSLFGLSMIIGYGKPTLLTLKLAIIFAKPDKNILIPGYLELDLPKKSKILHIEVNFLAIIDRQEGYFFFRADMVNSKIASFKLTGSLVFATDFGSNNGLFVLSVGGFHPSYKDQPEIPSLPNAFTGLDRLRLSFWDEGENHLYCEAYLAFTSNSIHYGVHAFLHVEGPMGFNIDGHYGYDVLVERDEDENIKIEASIEARIDFRHGEDVLAGVSLNATYTGPTPHKLEGKAKLRICWFLTVSIPFCWTCGDPAQEVSERRTDLLDLLLEQLEDIRNWRSEIPDFQHLHVSLRKDPNRLGNEILIQPLGALIFSQRTLPLNLEIQKVGLLKPNVVRAVEIGNISCNGTDFTDLKPTQELFAAGDFIELSDEEKLIRPSFERMTSGVRIGDTAISEYPEPFINAKDLEYELAYIVPDLPAKKAGTQILLKDQFLIHSRNASVSKSAMSWQSGGESQNSPNPVKVKRPRFVIGRTEDLRAHKGTNDQEFAAASQGEAEHIIRNILREQPELEGNIQIVKKHELIN